MQESENTEEDIFDGFKYDNICKAAAAIVVEAGSFHDPLYIHGIAHFVEHMLFMGTEKYPHEDAYDSFISRNGGSYNAYTDNEYTLFHFEICQENLFGALDMISQFFVKPQMLQDSIDRELLSIENEFQHHKNSDDCILDQLQSYTSDGYKDNSKDDTKRAVSINKIGKIEPHHAIAKFSWGNVETLWTIPKENKIGIIHELRIFFRKHYYALNIRLVVMGEFPLDQLEQQIVEKFQHIPLIPKDIVLNEKNEGLENKNKNIIIYEKY